MTKAICSLIALLAAIGCTQQSSSSMGAGPPVVTPGASNSGPFTAQELEEFTALDVIDSHTHIYQSAPAFFVLLHRLNVHVLDILYVETPNRDNLDTQSEQAWQFVHASGGRALLCSTFYPFDYQRHDFSQDAIASINRDFDRGAVAVKIWKNIGEKVKDRNGYYVMPDDPAFQPIYADIQAHNKTLVAHVADPNTIWEAPNPAAADYSYYMAHPEWYMYNIPNAPSKESLLRARDRLLEKNPNLRVVGAHLGSMEADFSQLGQHLDIYPNFAVDIAARMPYLAMQPRQYLIQFLDKYQDRLIYGTDASFSATDTVPEAIKRWEATYAFDWRFLATNDMLVYKGRNIQGLSLPLPLLRKLYHDNAVKWFAGISVSSH